MNQNFHFPSHFPLFSRESISKVWSLIEIKEAPRRDVWGDDQSDKTPPSTNTAPRALDFDEDDNDVLLLLQVTLLLSLVLGLLLPLPLPLRPAIAARFASTEKRTLRWYMISWSFGYTEKGLLDLEGRSESPCVRFYLDRWGDQANRWLVESCSRICLP